MKLSRPLLFIIALVTITATLSSLITQRYYSNTAKEPSLLVENRKPEPVLGMDLSHWNGTVNWNLLEREKLVFVFIKATQGTGYVDTTFATNWKASRENGYYRGAYHFFEPAADPKAQAEFFLKTVDLQKGDLLPAVDVEVTNKQTPEQVAAGLRTFVETVQQRIGRYPIIYCDAPFWNEDVAENLSKCPLWIAEWSSNTNPVLPKGWNSWVFWQYSATGTLKGVPSIGKTDLDRFNADQFNIRRYTLR
ncbi:MAG TPA: hypothetical protein DCP28_29675 [Cytophagales bacterium]|nr:hypothetical protein [Cytophagales bacterium]